MNSSLSASSLGTVWPYKRRPSLWKEHRGVDRFLHAAARFAHLACPPRARRNALATPCPCVSRKTSRPSTSARCGAGVCAQALAASRAAAQAARTSSAELCGARLTGPVGLLGCAVRTARRCSAAGSRRRNCRVGACVETAPAARESAFFRVRSRTAAGKPARANPARLKACSGTQN